MLTEACCECMRSVVCQCSVSCAMLTEACCECMRSVVCCQRSQAEYIIQGTVSTAERTGASRIKAFCW